MRGRRRSPTGAHPSLLGLRKGLACQRTRDPTDFAQFVTQRERPFAGELCVAELRKRLRVAELTLKSRMRRGHAPLFSTLGEHI